MAKVHEKRAGMRTTPAKQAKPFLKGVSTTVMIGIIVILLAAAIIAYNQYHIMKTLEQTSGEKAPKGNLETFQGYDGERVKVDFYVMSQCPYGTQVEDAIAPVLKTIGDAIDFNLNYIGGEEAGKFKSLHGEPEVKGDICQLCAAQYEPDKYMDMITCQNKNPQQIPNNWESCAQKVGMDVEKVRACYEGEEGKTLLRASFRQADLAGATGSPTIHINDQPYQGGRDTLSFQRVICANLDQHPGCKDIPVCAADTDCMAEPAKIGTCKDPNTKAAKCEYAEDAKVVVTVLNDKACATCDTTQLMAALKRVFKNTEVKQVDTSSAEGKALIEKHALKFVPAYLFDSNIENTYSWKTNPNLPGAFDRAGEGYRLKDAVTGASHYVDENVRKAFLAEIGVTTGDNRPQMDFFVMSYCPYGNLAEEAIYPVYQSLKGQADFNPHYIWSSQLYGGGPKYCIDPESVYCSLHGLQEANQNVRELCVKRDFGMDTWFTFTMAMNKQCTSQNADSCWEPVAKTLKLDVDKIKTCQKNDWKTLAAEDKALGDKLGASSSPTIYIDGEEFNGARSAAGYQAGLCRAFETAPGACTQALQEPEGTTAAASQGGCG